MKNGIVAACVLAVAALGIVGCSAASSAGSSGCTTWRVSQDGAVVASEYSTVGCDDGKLLTKSAGTLTPASSTPAHGSQVCNIPVSNGIGWKVYTGTSGDPNGEAQGVCGMFGATGVSTHSASAKGRAPGGNGKLLPPSCWLSFSDAAGDYGSLVQVVNADGGSVNCNEVISEMAQSIPAGYSALDTSQPAASDLAGNYSAVCSGMFYGDKVGVYAANSDVDNLADPTCQALLLNNG
jgi:hypothetical protein